MSALSVGDILTRVQRQFGDEAGIQVIQDDVIRWVNDCQREISMQHENLHQTTAAANTILGVNTVDLPADCLSVQEVKYKGTGDSVFFNLRYITPDEVSRFFFDTGTGAPVAYTRGQNSTDQIILFPTPDVSLAGSIQFVYSRYTEDVSTINDTLDLPEYYHQLVLEFCLMKAYEMDENWEAADRKSQYVQSTIDFNNGRGSWVDHKTYPTVSETEY